jgi:PEP-CTERM motif-containing protein
MITLNVTAQSGTTWSSANQVLFFNADGYDAAAHVFVCGTNCGDRSIAAIATGFAGENAAGGGGGGGGSIPEPSSIILLGTAALGAATALRKKRAKLS